MSDSILDLYLDDLVINSNPGIIALDDSFSGNENTSIAGDVGENDIKIADTFSPIYAKLSDPANGQVAFNSDGTFTYTPNNNYTGTDTFSYAVRSFDGDTGTATVTLTVNAVSNAPDAVDDAFTTNEDTALTGISVLANDSDPDTGDTLTVSAVNGAASNVGSEIILTSGTRLTLNADGTVDYDPNDAFETLAVNETDTDSFTYTVSDGNGGSDTATVTVTINGVNDGPVAVDDTGTTNEDTPVSIDVLGNDSDVDESDTLDVTRLNDTAVTVGSEIILTSGARLTLKADGTVDYDPNSAFEALAVNETDTDSFTYTVSDGNGGSDTATVTVTINGVNDGPVAVDDTGTTNEDTTVSIDVLGNDSDVDESDTLAVTRLNDTTVTAGSEIILTSGARLTLKANGTVDYDPNDAFEALAVNETGTDSFTYTVSDGKGGSDTATVTVTINGVNDGPVAADDTGTTNEDAPVSIDVLDNDSDVDDSDTLSVARLNGTTVTVGSEIILTSGARLTLKADGTVGSEIVLTSGARLTLKADGTVDYDPNDAFETLAVNETDTDSFTYTVSDGNGGSDTATVTVTINGVNDGPVAVTDTGTTNEDTTVSIDVLDNDSDVEDDDLSVIQASADSATVSIGTDGTLIYTPPPDFNGTDTITYTVSDGALTDTATVTVTVTPVNDAPVAADDAFSTDEDTPVSGNVLSDNGSGADSDIDVDALTVSLLQDVSGGTLTLGTDGAFTYIPGVNVSGVDMFAYQVSDGDLIDTATVTIAVDPVNDPPVAQDDALATDEDTAISGDLTADNGNGPDSDVDGDTPLVYLVNGQLGGVDGTTSLPSGALLTVFADGRYFYDPNGAFDHLALGETAIDSFTYAIFDGNGGVDSATATVTIDGVNDAPDAVDDVFSTDKDSGVFGNVLADNGNGADSDPDGGTSLIVTHVNGSAAAVGSQILLPSGALLMLNADGSFLYGTNGAFEALGDDESFADSFTYTIGDGDGGSDGATATVTIDGGNEAPVAADDALATDEDTAITGNVFSDNGNGPDSDANGDTLTVSAVNGAAAAVGNEIMLPSGARLTLNSNGSFVYDPMGAFDDLSPGEADTDGFTYTVTDGKGGSATATVSIGIDGLLDVIRGTPQEDDLTGTDGDDLIYALASDDIIDPRGGSHMIDGGSGTDTVVYATTRSVFDVDLMQASGFTVAGESAALVGGNIVVERPDGETDTLIDVERIDFTDGDLIYDIDSPNVEVVYRMYAAALGRTPDETGLRYWVDRLDFLDDLPGSTADGLLQVLADVFIEADEFEMLYGSDPSNADYIDAMYQNVLGRLPDEEGRAFWIDAMERGLERDDILIAFSESAENRDQTAPDLDDGIWVL